MIIHLLIDFKDLLIGWLLDGLILYWMYFDSRPKEWAPFLSQLERIDLRIVCTLLTSAKFFDLFLFEVDSFGDPPSLESGDALRNDVFGLMIHELLTEFVMVWSFCFVL